MQTALAAEPEVRRILAAPAGRGLVGEGDTLIQPDLAGVLANIRVSGPIDFYTGTLADSFAADVRKAGGSTTARDLADYLPHWLQPLAISYDDKRAYFAPPPPAGGVIAGEMWAMLAKDDAYVDATETERDALVVTTAERAFADRRQWPEDIADPQSLVSSAHVEALMAETRGATTSAAATSRPPATENPAAASFIAIDVEGGAVACTVTLNSLFGTGRVAAGTGIVLASLPGQGGRGASMLTPMLVVKPSGRQFVFAGAAAGGVTAPTALVDVAARTLLAHEPVAAALAAPRMHGGSDPGYVFIEPGVSPQSVQALVNQGDTAVSVDRHLGEVNAIACPDGILSAPERCVAATDPRGLGLAASTE
ncbi:MAG: gamma-glutamyltransferase [Rhodospirillales bacterium]|nr:gamma-glutamyltransferase [Rhodospirillales bacterium]